jgi:putative membrane protein
MPALETAGEVARRRRAHHNRGVDQIDYRFTLANERTFLAWIRTALALVAGGVAAAKALDFDHEVWRWVIAVPPMAAGTVLAFEAQRRWRLYEREMRAGRPLPAERRVAVVGVLVAVYAVVALIATVLD